MTGRRGRRSLKSHGLAAVLVSAAFGLLLVSGLVRPVPAGRWYALALAGIAAHLAQHLALAAMPEERAGGPFDAVAAPAVAPGPEMPSSVVDLERLVRLGTAGTTDLHYRLRPVLREVARARMAQCGIDLDYGDRSRAVLGERGFDLVRSGKEAPEDRDGPGAGLAEVAGLVAALEALPR